MHAVSNRCLPIRSAARHLANGVAIGPRRLSPAQAAITEFDAVLGSGDCNPHLARGSRVRLSSGLRVFAVLVVLAALLLAIPVAMPVVAQPG